MSTTYRVQISVSLGNGDSVIGEGLCAYDEIDDCIRASVASWVAEGHCTWDNEYAAWWMVREERKGKLMDLFAGHKAICAPEGGPLG